MIYIIQKCEYFNIKELVPEHIYNKYKEKAWQFFDINVLITLDALRRRFGPLIVNNWASGGEFSERGLRSLDYGGIFNRSLHKHGKAIDLHSNKYTAEEMRSYIIDNPKEFEHIKCLEMGVNWLHFDTRNRRAEDGIFLVYPK
jgi:hypothetical protein